MTPQPEDDADPVHAIRLHSRAREDIDAAHSRFAELVGNAIADEWQDGLFTALATLARLPRRQMVAPESRHFRREVRQLLYRRRSEAVAYRILFTVVSEVEEEAPFVFILHVRHGSARPMSRAEAREIEAAS